MSDIFAQWSGGNEPAVLEATLCIDDNEREILGDLEILKTVIHDDDVRPERIRKARAVCAIASHDDGAVRCQQQRLIAHVRGRMLRRAHPDGTAQSSAIATAEKCDLFSARGQCAPYGDGNRRLAGPARGQIADADDSRLGAEWSRPM